MIELISSTLYSVHVEPTNASANAEVRKRAFLTHHQKISAQLKHCGNHIHFGSFKCTILPCTQKTVTRRLAMKSHIPLVLVTALLSASTAIASTGFQAQLSSIDQSFSQQGASFELLDQYDALIRQLPESENSALLATVHYKRAIVALSLGKEAQAMDDLYDSVKLDKANFAAKSSLLKMIVKNGDHSRLNSVRTVLSDSDPTLKEAMDQMALVAELSTSNDIEKLSEAIQMSPFDPSLRELRIKLTEEIIKKPSSSVDQRSLFADLVDDMNIMIKANPAKNSGNWNKLTGIYLFGLGEFTTALNANKKCLHYDMDFEPCKKNSKLLNKYSGIFNQLTSHNRYLQHLNGDVKDDEIKVLDEIDFKDLSTRLTSQDKFLKIRRENEQFITNLAFIEHKSSQFNNQFSLKSNTLDEIIYESLAMDALLRHDAKSFKLYGSRVSDTSLPRRLDSIDRALHKKDFNKANQEIQQSPKNMRESHFFQARLEKIQKHQQQQQQQQQHQRQQQQQHFGGRQQAPKSPKNDYYKILGVAKDADDRTIKKAYRDLLKQFHPDKYKGDMTQEEVEHKMTQINHAYEVLSDEGLRKDYDMGHDPNDPEAQRGGPPGGNPFGGGQPRQGSGNPFGSGRFNFQFGQGGPQFGGMGKGQKANRRQ